MGRACKSTIPLADSALANPLTYVFFDRRRQSYGARGDGISHVHSQTGIPAASDDPLCPQRNRPAVMAGGNPLTTFTMDPRGAAPSPASPVPNRFNSLRSFRSGRLCDLRRHIDWMAPKRKVCFRTHRDRQCRHLHHAGVMIPRTSPSMWCLQGSPWHSQSGVPAGSNRQGSGSRVLHRSLSPHRHLLPSIRTCNGAITETCGLGIRVFPLSKDRRTAGREGGVYRFFPNGRRIPATSPAISEFESTFRLRLVYNTTLGIVAGRYQAPNFAYIFPENLSIGAPPVTTELQ